MLGMSNSYRTYFHRRCRAQLAGRPPPLAEEGPRFVKNILIDELSVLSASTPVESVIGEFVIRVTEISRHGE